MVVSLVVPGLAKLVNRTSRLTFTACISAFVLLFLLLVVVSTTGLNEELDAVDRRVEARAAAPLATPVDPAASDQHAPGAAPIPAFPGAEGWGAYSVGGRGGRVIEVSNRYNRGPGSLRACVEAAGPRICVFRVNGIIELHSPIEVRNPFLTIAGQTAPGSGIYLRSDPQNEEGLGGLLRFPEFSKDYKGGLAHNVVLRYLRIRHGRAPTQKYFGRRPKNLEILSGHDIIVDHVSLGWVNDNLMTVVASEVPGSPPIERITLQRSILAESLQGHSTGLNIQGQGEEEYEWWRNVRNISVHHNLFSNNGHRNPRVTSSGTTVINNVVYNWQNRVSDTTRGSVIDWINNYWKIGPNSDPSKILLHEDRPGQQMPLYNSTPSIYIAGNIVAPTFLDPSADNWPLYALTFEDYAPLHTSYRRFTPLPAAPVPETIQSAAEAYDSVLNDVGANKRLDCEGNWVPNLDAIDARVVAEVLNDTGPQSLLYHENDVGGFPKFEPAIPCSDTDHDGMPDAWEQKYTFNIDLATDNSEDADGDGYTNVEEFLNGTNPKSSDSTVSQRE